MALSGAERAQVRMRLEWPARFFQTDDRLEQAMNALQSHPHDEDLVRVELERCNTIDTEIDGIAVLEKATMVGEIQTRAAYTLANKRSRMREAVRRIARIVGCPLYSARSSGDFAGRCGPED